MITQRNVTLAIKTIPPFFFLELLAQTVRTSVVVPKKNTFNKEVMNAKDSVAAYCRAQSEINKVDKTNEEQRKSLNERIKTCRSLLHDELANKQITCIEVYDDTETDPYYFRLKPQVSNANICMDDIAHVLAHLNRDVLNACAEKHNHDLPKMVLSTIQTYIKEEKRKSDKTTLTISNSRERGYNRDLKTEIAPETMQVAKDLLSARKELNGLKQKQSTDKKESLTVQKEVESVVKEALKKSDPQNMTTRVHMMQGDSEWVYYLRCKETERSAPLGIRRILPLVEKALLLLLDEHGMSREYNGTQIFSNDFWDTLSRRIATDLEKMSQEKKTVSKLSLDKAAPRKRN